MNKNGSRDGGSFKGGNRGGAGNGGTPNKGRPGGWSPVKGGGNSGNAGKTETAGWNPVKGGASSGNSGKTETAGWNAVKGGASSGNSGKGGKGQRAADGSNAKGRGSANGGRGNRPTRVQQDSEVLSGLPVVRNEEYEAEIVGIGHEGEGVGRVNGFTLFVQGALPGERALVKVMKLKKQYGYAKLLKIVKPSADRVKAPCPIYAQCGGCQLQHLSYEAQLHFKRQLVVDNLERIGKLKVAAGTAGRARGEAEAASGIMGAGTAGNRGNGIVVHETLGMEQPWRYRNKAQVPIGLSAVSSGFEAASAASGAYAEAVREGGLVGGFYAQGSHRIIDMDECLIQQENNDRVVSEVKRIAQELGIRAYHEETGKGLLRHVVARYGFNTGDIMVVLITNGLDIPHKDEFVGLLRTAIPGIKSICQNVNTARTNVIFGEQTKVLWGDDVIYDTIGDIRFAISARSFFQVNPVQTEVLYGKALEFAGLSGEEIVIDAYCGIGTISLFLAQRARQVFGVEIVSEAIDDARRNALLNGIRNVQFEAGAAEVVIPEWRRKGIAPDVIVVDPPRKGCDAALLATILEMRPARVVYVSCNPSTLARDLRVLEDGGYSTVEVQPVDMFPHTVHVESVILMVRK